MNPGLEAKTLFLDLQRRYPGRFQDGQLRTFQRLVKRWRATISGDYLRPDELEKVQTKPEEMNASQLQEFLSRFRRIGGESRRWEVELYAKAAHPVAAIIIVVFGAPIAAVRRRGGTALGFGLSLFICFLYFGLIQTGKILGMKGVLDPWFSAWIGNIVFAVLGFGLLFRKTE